MGHGVTFNMPAHTCYWIFDPSGCTARDMVQTQLRTQRAAQLVSDRPDCDGLILAKKEDDDGELEPITDHVVHNMISGWKLTTKEEKRRLLSQTSNMGMSDMSDGDSVSLPSILMAR